jgi:hypothetical protein
VVLYDSSLWWFWFQTLDITTRLPTSTLISLKAPHTPTKE